MSITQHLRPSNPCSPPRDSRAAIGPKTPTTTLLLSLLFGSFRDAPAIRSIVPRGGNMTASYPSDVGAVVPAPHPPKRFQRAGLQALPTRPSPGASPTPGNRKGVIS